MELDVITKKVWLSEKETEVYTGFGRKKLRELRYKGVDGSFLPFSQIGGSIRYKRTEIDKFFESQKVTGVL